MMNAAVSWTMAERLEELGHISADRMRLFPAPGTATVDDLMDANTHRKPLCELIDQTLVEKAGGFESSVVAVRSPNSQNNAAAAIGSRITKVGRGDSRATSGHFRHTSHKTMGGTTKAWVKVLERYQIVTIATAVSQYSNTMVVRTRPSASKGKRQAACAPGTE